MDSDGPLVTTPCVWEYWPVRKEARLGAQTEFVTNISVNRIPSAPIRSMFGVLRIELPYALMARCCWSSVMMKIIFGAAVGTGRICAKLLRARDGAIDRAAPVIPSDFSNSRRFMVIGWDLPIARITEPSAVAPDQRDDF